MQARRLSRSIHRALLAMSACVLSPGLVQAQDADAPDETRAAATLDAVQVTGSRLKRAQAEGATPVIVIDRARIDASGDISVADLLRDLPLASAGNFRPQSGSSAQSLATVNLRGLGANRTLVLVDGRRAPTNPMNASQGADLNAIPLGAVERIEVLADGASAIYGSDAIGGVVNIILRRDFNGAELRYGLGSTEVQGGDLEEMSVLFGSTTDRTRLIGGASASKRGMVFTRDQIGGDQLGVTPYGNNYYDWNTGLLRAVPGFDCSQGAFYVQDGGLCSFNFNSVAAQEAKVGTRAVYFRADHRINDDWSLYAAGSQTLVQSFGRYAPVPGLVMVDDGTPNDVDPSDGLPTYFYHRFAALGNRDTSTDASNGDYLAGFQGQLTDRISVDVGLRRTDYKFIELGRGYVVSALANAFANSGAYDLSDPYGADPAVLAGMQATTSRESRWQTDEIHAIANVDLFDMGGGQSSAVFGVEYRRGRYQDRYDALSEGGAILGTAGNSSGGDRDVGAAFFEWLLPLSQQFDITLAGRYDDYSDYGDEFSPKVALRWQPLDQLSLRGSYSEGFAAPGLDILTQGRVFSADPVNDPLTCQAFGQPSTCEVQVNTYFNGNPDLGSESSRQFSLGLAWDPTEWLDLSLDYFDIRIDDVITRFSAQDVVLFASNPALYGPLPPGMRVDRGSDGRIILVEAGFVNRGGLDTRGVDLRIDTRFALGGGELASQLAVSHMLDYESRGVFGNSTDRPASLGYPEWRAGLANTWALGDFSVGWNVHYIDGQSGGAPANTVGSYTTHDLQVAWSTPWRGTVTFGATNVGDRYPALVAYDGRPFNFNLYDAYGRTTYLRYTQAF